MRVALTGARGFVGSCLTETLRSTGWSVSPYIFTDMLRGNGGDIPAGTDVVVHLAARVHVMRDKPAFPIEAFRDANVRGTLALAERAALAGVSRFIFVSSIKVLGEETEPGRPFQAGDAPAPADAYGRSKLEAEEGLNEFCRSRGIELCIIRPPLVYGPGVKANLETLTRLIYKGIPLPFGAISNARSMVDVRNLCDLIRTCCHDPAASNQTFLAADGDDLSTPDLIRYVAQGLKRTPRLVHVPEALLRTVAGITGRQAYFKRLCGFLQVDIRHTQEVLGWVPPYAARDGLCRMAESWIKDNETAYM